IFTVDSRLGARHTAPARGADARNAMDRARTGTRITTALSHHATQERALWCVVAAFVAAGLLLLPSRQHTFDEGLYIQQALLILRGQLPYRDFFYHQTPLYPFVLAVVGWLLSPSVFVFRALSLVATAATGVLVHRIAGRFVAPNAAVCATVFFY